MEIDVRIVVQVCSTIEVFQAFRYVTMMVCNTTANYLTCLSEQIIIIITIHDGHPKMILLHDAPMYTVYVSFSDC